MKKNTHFSWHHKSPSVGAAASTLRKRFLRSESNQTKSRCIWSCLLLPCEDPPHPPVRDLRKAFFSVCMRFVCRSFRSFTWECEILLFWALSCFLLRLAVGNLQLGSIFFFPRKRLFQCHRGRALHHGAFVSPGCCFFFSFSPLSLNSSSSSTLWRGSGLEKKSGLMRFPPAFSLAWGLQSFVYFRWRSDYHAPQSKDFTFLPRANFSLAWSLSTALISWFVGGKNGKRNARLFNKVGGRHQWASLCLTVALPALFRF